MSKWDGINNSFLSVFTHFVQQFRLSRWFASMLFYVARGRTLGGRNEEEEQRRKFT